MESMTDWAFSWPISAGGEKRDVVSLLGGERFGGEWKEKGKGN